MATTTPTQGRRNREQELTPQAESLAESPGFADAESDPRTCTAAVRRYLEHLSSPHRGPGRRRTAESIRRQLKALAEQLPNATSIERLLLLQRRIDLNKELDALESVAAAAQIESGFIAYAKLYADRKGISWEAWREVGVAAKVLRSAGISR